MVVEHRIMNFANLGFGMFVHFGAYSQLGQGEWVKCLHHLHDEEYETMARKFNPKNFNAEELVRMAKNAGCKYITLTTRHHEGFSLYDTCGLNDYDTIHSCGRDLVREFVEACHRNDISPFFYHTTIDWYNKDYQIDESGDFKKYLQYLRESVQVLCTQYGKIGGIWFDGNWQKPTADWEEDSLYALIRKYQPEAIIINNTGLSAHGALGNRELDSVTFERGKPQPINMEDSPKFLASEMCQILNNHWGFSALDLDYKSMRELIENLAECRKYGANFLLNIGPKSDGSIDSYDRAVFEKFSLWNRINGEAIYDPKPCLLTCDNQTDFILKKNSREFYLFVFGLGIVGNNDVVVGQSTAKKIKIEKIKAIKSAMWLDNQEALQINGNILNATQFIYGNDLVVRVAKLEIEE